MHTRLFFPRLDYNVPPRNKRGIHETEMSSSREPPSGQTLVVFAVFQIIQRMGFTPQSGTAGVYPGLSGENHGAMPAALQPVSKEVETHLHSPMSGLAAGCMYLFSSSYTYRYRYPTQLLVD